MHAYMIPFKPSISLISNRSQPNQGTTLSLNMNRHWVLDFIQVVKSQALQTILFKPPPTEFNKPEPHGFSANTQNPRSSITTYIELTPVLVSCDVHSKNSTTGRYGRSCQFKKWVSCSTYTEKLHDWSFVDSTDASNQHERCTPTLVHRLTCTGFAAFV